MSLIEREMVYFQLQNDLDIKVASLWRNIVSTPQCFLKGKKRDVQGDPTVPFIGGWSCPSHSCSI